MGRKLLSATVEALGNNVVACRFDWEASLTATGKTRLSQAVLRCKASALAPHSGDPIRYLESAGSGLVEVILPPMRAGSRLSAQVRPGRQAIHADRFLFLLEIADSELYGTPLPADSKPTDSKPADASKPAAAAKSK